MELQELLYMGHDKHVHCLDCDDDFKVHTPIKSHKIACFKYVQFTLCYTVYNI